MKPALSTALCQKQKSNGRKEGVYGGKDLWKRWASSGSERRGVTDEERGDPTKEVGVVEAKRG